MRVMLLSPQYGCRVCVPNKYANVPLEQRIPYNETGDMLGINKLNPSEPPVKVPYKESGHMVRGIMSRS